MTPDHSDSENELLTIRQMCEQFGVTPRTLRFYEAKELIFPLRRGQARFYSRQDRGRLKLILRGKRFGFALEEMRQLLDLYERGDAQEEQLRRTYSAAEDRLAQMERQRAELDEAITDLKADLAWGAERIGALRRTAAE